LTTVDERIPCTAFRPSMMARDPISKRPSSFSLTSAGRLSARNQ
jgi:hypothetical protein